jgi:glucosamine-6-phosphate deaminase
VNTIIADRSDEVARIAARILGHAIQRRPNTNIGLSAGRTAREVYFRFFQEFNADQMKNIVTTNFFSVTEHFGINPGNPNSYYHWFQEAFFNKIRENWGLHIPEENKKLVPSTIERDTMEGFRLWYDQHLQINKVAVQIISPAPDGQIISIDPNICSVDEMLNMGTSLVRYSKQTSNYLVPVSPHDIDIVIGMKNLLERSERLVIPACGAEKKEVVRRMILGPVGNNCPASLVARYPRVDRLLFVIDRESAEALPREISHHINLIPSERWDVIW